MEMTVELDEAAALRFKTTTEKLGITPETAMRMFVMAFNRAGGFPYDVRVPQEENQASQPTFASEEEVLNALRVALEMKRCFDEAEDARR